MTVPIEKKLQELMKMKKKLQKIYPTDQRKIYGKVIIKSVNNLNEGIHKTKCKYEHDDKSVKLSYCI